MLKNFKYSIITLIILPLIVIPFILKSIKRILEPFPAVIFPAGARKVKINNSKILMTQSKFYGKLIGNKNNWVELPIKEFCQPLPPIFCSRLWKTNFGQKKLGQHFLSSR